MTWGNRNPQPKENQMSELLKRIDAMLKGDIAIATNEGFTRGVKWQRNQREDDAIAKARNEGFDEGVMWQRDNQNDAKAYAYHKTQADTEGVKLIELPPIQQETGYYIDSQIVTKKEYERHLKKLNPTDENLDPAPEHNEATCECCPDPYQQYNDDIWPGEKE